MTMLITMMTMMTIEAQMDPTVMVGSNLPAIGGTLRIEREHGTRFVLAFPAAGTSAGC